MEYDVVIPNFDEENASVVVSKWYKKSGDKVTRGEILADIDSDTSACSVAAPVDGSLGAIFIPEGLNTQIGAVIGTITGSNETTSSYISSENIQKVDGITAEDARLELQEEEEKQNIKDAVQEIDAEAAFQGTVENDSPEQKLNENLKALLKDDTNISVHDIFNDIEKNKNMHVHYNHSGTAATSSTVKIIDDDNPDVVTVKTQKEDVVTAPADHIHNNEKSDDLAVANELAKNITEDKPETDPNLWNNVTKISTPNDVVSTIGELEVSLAERRKKAASTAVISTVINEIDMSAIIDAAKFFGNSFFDKYSVRIGYTAFILKAAVKALQEYPMFNAYILENNEVVFKKNYDVSIITQGLDSLPSPVIRNVDALSIKEIQESVTCLAERAKNRTLTLEESSGATFTLINSGIYGSLLGSDVVAYPQIAALTMHKVCERPVVLNGSIVIKPMMYVSLSFDHRIANSQSASLFVQQVKKMSENLSWMALGI